MDRTVLTWLLIGAAGFCLLPWYTLEDGFWGFEWLFDCYPFDTDYAPGLFLWTGSQTDGTNLGPDR